MREAFTNSAARARTQLASLIRAALTTALLLLFCVPGGAVQLRVPAEFAVQLAASEPQIRFPMFAALDDRGRLLVAESSGLDLYEEISAGTRKCQVRRLEDRDRDGTYESAEVFADKLVFPMGLAWRDGKLYIADPPELITLEDSNGDGRADKRTVILSSFGALDNGSLHGLVFGPDGLLYMTTGQPDGYRFDLPNGAVLEGKSGALIRCRPDGSNPEVLARGFENLIEVVFLPGGEIIGTDNWYQQPKAGIRDALLHLVEGGLYPMHPDTGTPQPVTGDKLPPLSLFPAVALSGLARYEGGAFPTEYHGNLFSAQHNSRSVGRHVLRRHGSTFRSEDSEFLTTDDPDFHPSDVLEDRDGSLLVLDTGSWYTQHCPTGRIRKSPATGGIYRVRPKVTNKRGRALPPPIWNMASDTLRTDQLRTSLASTDIDTVSAAARVIGLRRLQGFTADLSELVRSNPPVQLAAAEALARGADPNALPSLIAVLEKPVDPFLEHALIHALHRTAPQAALSDLLNHKNARLQKAALLLLSQPPRPPDALKAEAVLSRLASPDAELRQTALQLLKSRPAWAADALRVAREWLAHFKPEHRERLQSLCSAFFNTPGLQELLQQHVNDQPEAGKFVLDMIASEPAPKRLAGWTAVLRNALARETANLRAPAARVAVAWRVRELAPELERLALDPAQPAGVRRECLRGIVASYSPLPDPMFEFLLAELRGGDALAAGDLLRSARLTDAQTVRALKTANALVPAASLLIAFHTTTSAAQTRSLLDTVATLPPAGWAEGEYAQFASRLPRELRPEAEKIRERFQPDRDAQQARMAAFEPLLNGGDPERGRAVFASAKVACAACHAVGDQGGKVGPDLTRLGAIRAGRDILESILFPSSTFAQHYESFTVQTKDGEEHSGVLVAQDDQRVSLRTVAGAEITLAKSTIQELRRNNLSIMPEGLENAMTGQEFRDLLAFLQSLK